MFLTNKLLEERNGFDCIKYPQSIVDDVTCFKQRSIDTFDSPKSIGMSI